MFLKNVLFAVSLQKWFAYFLLIRINRKIHRNNHFPSQKNEVSKVLYYKSGFAWRVSKNYAYSPFNRKHLMRILYKALV